MTKIDAQWNYNSFSVTLPEEEITRRLNQSGIACVLFEKNENGNIDITVVEDYLAPHLGEMSKAAESAAKVWGKIEFEDNDTATDISPDGLNPKHYGY